MQRVFWRLQQEAPLLKLEQVVAGLSDAMRITWAPCEYLVCKADDFHSLVTHWMHVGA